MKKLCFTILLGTIMATAEAASAIVVPVSFVEALAPKDTTSSERFRAEYQNAVTIALEYNKADLSRCGYQIAPQYTFFDASDELQAFERARAATSEGKWLIIGPRRSQQYLVLAKGAADTPTVSTMASSSEVFALEAIHSTMAPSNAQMAKVSAKVARAKASTYFSIVNSDCVSCRDFSKQFDSSALKVGLKKLGEKEVTGDDPELGDLLLQLQKLKPQVILLPNYSKPSSQVMLKLKTLTPAPIFIGADGWGDSRFGFVGTGTAPDQAMGFTVRGFPPIDEGLKTFSVGNRILKKKSSIPDFPGSGSAQSLIKIVSDLTGFLCGTKPKTKATFAAAIKKSNPFKPTWGVSIYKLENANITFERIEKVSRQ